MHPRRGLRTESCPHLGLGQALASSLGGTEVLLFCLPSRVALGNFGSSKDLGNESGESTAWGPSREMIRALGTAKRVLIALGPSPHQTPSWGLSWSQGLLPLGLARAGVWEFVGLKL